LGHAGGAPRTVAIHNNIEHFSQRRQDKIEFSGVVGVLAASAPINHHQVASALNAALISRGGARARLEPGA
jgi:hypothetical protein